MKVKIAVLGSAMRVNDICEVSEEFNDVEMIPMVVDSLLDAPSLAAKSKGLADVTLFAGPIPYSLSQEVLADDIPSTFVPIEGTAFYSVLMRIYLKYNFLPIISFDAVNPQHVDEVYDELGFSHISRFIETYKSFDFEELIQHHLKLWEEKKIQVIVTGVHTVYERFLEMGIPVFSVKYPKQTIRETLNRAILVGKEKKKHLSQITVLQFQIDQNNAGKVNDVAKIKQKILEYGNSLFSISGNSGGDRITLYTTRGVLERVSNNRENFTILHEIRNNFSHTISLGIGMGDTGDSAVDNANKALLIAQENGGDCVFLIDDVKRVHGPLGSPQSLEYPLLSAQDGSFASLSLRKFYAWIQKMGKNQMTVRDVGIGMNISNRHAARIIKELHEKGIVEVVGRESTNQRGRPRPVYEIDLDSLTAEMSK